MTNLLIKELADLADQIIIHSSFFSCSIHVCKKHISWNHFSKMLILSVSMVGYVPHKQKYSVICENQNTCIWCRSYWNYTLWKRYRYDITNNASYTFLFISKKWVKSILKGILQQCVNIAYNYRRDIICEIKWFI